MSTADKITRATFTPQTGNSKGKALDVHFNPVSLQYTVTNTLQEQGKKKKQYVTKTSAKLTMDLVFDTTANGEDVRTYTEKVAKFMEPVKEPGGKEQIPAIVEFEWGLYKFQGMVESYKETLDFFAANGVPLRASVNLTLTRQEHVFDPGKHGQASTTGALTPTPEPVDVPSGPGGDATSTAARGGDPSAGRGIAAANGLQSMRFPTGPTLTVGGGIRLSPPVAFATGGAGLSVGGAAGVGVGGGIGIGAGASAGFGGGVGVGGGLGLSAGGGLAVSNGFAAGATFGAGVGVSGGAVFGGTASAGVSASAGAFAGLWTSTSTDGGRSLATLDTSRFVQTSESVSFATAGGASFNLGGQAVVEGSAGLTADVGAAVSLRDRIQFQETF